jgi:sugar-phosphatase
VPGAESTLAVVPEAIVFDCDGVLIDSDAGVVAAWTAWALSRDLDPSAVIAVCHGQPARATVRAFVAADVAEAALADIDRLELGLASEARSLPGALALLRALPAGRWGLCTSGNRALASARLAASGIELPAVFVTADDVQRGKPDPEGYARALARLGADPSGSVVVEDAPNGVAAAREAGVGTVIGVGKRAIGTDIDAIVADLRGVVWVGGRLVVRGTDPVA